MNPIQVLMVDDDPADVLLTRRALKKSKLFIEMAHAHDGVEALARLRREGKHAETVLPDLVLLDLNMPRMGGLEMLEEMKGDPTLSKIPVVVLTTSDNTSDVETAYLQHANSYVQKPVDLATFTQIVTDISHFWFTVARIP